MQCKCNRYIDYHQVVYQISKPVLEVVLCFSHNFPRICGKCELFNSHNLVAAPLCPLVIWRSLISSVQGSMRGGWKGALLLAVPPRWFTAWQGSCWTETSLEVRKTCGWKRRIGSEFKAMQSSIGHGLVLWNCLDSFRLPQHPQDGSTKLCWVWFTVCLQK